MKYFTKDWYKSGCPKSKEAESYYKYYEIHKAKFPAWWSEISLHDARVLSNKMTQKELTVEFLLSGSYQSILLKLNDPKIIKPCDLCNKICLAEELYVKNGYEFHLLLSDSENELYEFTVCCSKIESTARDSISVFSLAAYGIPSSPCFCDKGFFDNNSKQIVCLKKLKSKNTDSLFPLPKIERAELLFDYLKQLNNKKINDYLALFNNDFSYRRSGELEICLKTNNRLLPIKYTDGYFAYCMQRFLPLAKEWGEKYCVEIYCQYPQLSEFRRATFSDEEIYVPTDGLRISQSKYLCLEKNNCFDKRTYLCKSWREASDSENTVDFPFVDEEKLKQIFLRSHNLEKSADTLQSQLYFAFRDEYLDKALVQWCKDTQIKYQAE